MCSSDLPSPGRVQCLALVRVPDGALRLPRLPLQIMVSDPSTVNDFPSLHQSAYVQLCGCANDFQVQTHDRSVSLDVEANAPV